METRTYQVYRFEELPEDAKEKVLQNYYSINVDFAGWYEDDGYLELSAEEMKKAKIKLSKNWYNSNKPKDHQGNIFGEYPAYTGLFN